MANDVAQKITELTALAKGVPEDLLVAVDDPDGAGKKTRKLGFGTFLKTYNRSAAEIANGLSNDDLDFKNDQGVVNRYGENTTPGTTDMTNAGQTAIDLRKRVKFLEETYLISTLDYGTPTFANQMDIIGPSGKNNTVLKASGAGPILKLGSPSMTNFIAGIAIRGITFEGNDSTTTEGLVSRGLVRSVIDNCKFEKCIIGLSDFGALDNLYNNCHFDGNGTGLKFDLFSGAFYTGDPNNNTVSHCYPINNTDWGIDFDFGRLLNVIACDFEGNGHNPLGPDFGALRIRTNAGTRITNFEMALNLFGCWFEANLGIAEILLEGGFNSIEKAYMRTAATGSTYDVRIEGGQYSIRDLNCAVVKTANISEAVSIQVQFGNIIDGGEIPNISVDPFKTTILANRGKTNNISNKLKIAVTDSGVTAPADGDHFVVESSGKTVISVLSGNTNEGRLVFGDDGSAFVGWLEYDHNTDSMNVRVNGSNRMTIASGGSIKAITGPNLSADVVTLDNTGTPTVAGSNLFKTGGATAITDFDDGVVGQTIQIISADTITITDGSPIILSGSVNFSMVATDTLTLTMFDDQIWQEVGRSVN